MYGVFMVESSLRNNHDRRESPVKIKKGFKHQGGAQLGARQDASITILWSISLSVPHDLSIFLLWGVPSPTMNGTRFLVRNS